MKTPIQLWNEYRTGIHGQTPMLRSQEAQLRHAFVAGMEATLEVLKRGPDAATLDWFTNLVKGLKDGPPQEGATLNIDAMIQQFRTLRLSQLRHQLEADDKHNIDRLIHVNHFLKLAKERMG